MATADNPWVCPHCAKGSPFPGTCGGSFLDSSHPSMVVMVPRDEWLASSITDREEGSDRER